MAAFLTTAQSTILNWVVDYLKGGHNSSTGLVDKPFDDKAVQELAKLHAKLGYTSEIAFREAMRDNPHTLWFAIQYLNAMPKGKNSKDDDTQGQNPQWPGEDCRYAGEKDTEKSKQTPGLTEETVIPLVQ
jgi:hypothetical protein